MEGGFRPSFQSSGERRLEIVSGRGFNSNQIYLTTATTTTTTTTPPSYWSSDPPPPPVIPRRSSSSSKPWGGFSDPEMKRKKRVAKYKVYTIEGRVKASFRNGIRWIKAKCSEIIHGF